MKIVADSQIPLVQQAFASTGDLVLCAGRDITANTVKDADILLVRSITPVNSSLLENSRVKFVATATSGTDHIDMEYLQSAGIGYAAARGNNAQSVVEYVLSSLCVLAGQNNFDLRKKTVGIIGCGEVGSRLLRALTALGSECLVNDPPLKDSTDGKSYVDLREVMGTDIITLHVPLTSAGKYPTRYLVDEMLLKEVNPAAVLINTSRGGVINESALMQFIKHNKQFSAVLDVWEHEPQINPELLSNVAIGTSHIAGYAIDAKIRATQMIYDETCTFFNLARDWKPASGLLDVGQREFTIAAEVTDSDAMSMAILAHYDVRSDAADLRRALELDRNKTAYYFDELRKNYPLRREYPATVLNLTAGRNDLARISEQLGFSVSMP